jgi:hypothetical protein
MCRLKTFFARPTTKADRRGEALCVRFIIERSEAAQIYKPGSLTRSQFMLSNTREKNRRRLNS